MKKILMTVAAVAAYLALLQVYGLGQVNVQKAQGTNQLSNGSIVVGNGISITATGTGSIVATGGAATSLPYSGITLVPVTSLLGNATGSIINAEAITLAADLMFTGTTLDTIQPITTASSPTFAGLTLSSPLTGANGGTGVANTGKTITLGGNLTTSGAFASTFTMTALTAVTFPTTGTLATTSNLPVGANPTGTIASAAGSVVNGSAATFLRSDGAPALPATMTGITSINRVTLTAPATAATITLADNSTLSTANNFTTTGDFAVTQTYTAPTNVTFPSSGTLATTASLPVAANPTGTISSTAGSVVNGSASTFLRSDGAPALPSSITGVTTMTAAAASPLSLNGGAGTGTSANISLGSGSTGATVFSNGGFPTITFSADNNIFCAVNAQFTVQSSSAHETNLIITNDAPDEYSAEIFKNTGTGGRTWEIFVGGHTSTPNPDDLGIEINTNRMFLLDPTGFLTLQNNIASTTYQNGTLVLGGGAGIAGNINGNGNLAVAGTAHSTGDMSTAANFTATGNVTTTNGNVFFGGSTDKLIQTASGQLQFETNKGTGTAQVFGVRNAGVGEVDLVMANSTSGTDWQWQILEGSTNLGLTKGGAQLLNVSSAGAVGIGTGSTSSIAQLQVVDTGTSSPRGITDDQYNTGTNSAQFNARKARGTFASPTTVVTGDILSRFLAWGHDGTQFIESGNLRFTSSGTIATNRVPSQAEIWTSTNAAPSVLTKAVTWDSSQNETVVGNISAANLSLGGTLTTGAAFTTTPANAVTLTTTGSTNVTLPTSGTLLTGNQTITLSGDVTGSGTTAITTTVAKIAGTTVSGTTGTTNAVFSGSPTITTPVISTVTAATSTALTLSAGATGNNDVVTLPVGTGSTWVLADNLTHRPTVPGNLVINDTNTNGAAVRGGLEFEYADINSGYGARLKDEGNADAFIIQTRFNSATWTTQMSMLNQTGATTFTSTVTASGLAETGATFKGTVTLSSGAGTITSAAIATTSCVILTRVTTSGAGVYPQIDAGSGSATITGAATDNGTYNWRVIQ